ncbi:CAAX prenyl protease-like protein [Labedella gwakjiensis]|uniref:CAAX prenyl protease-like protein n=1 Tax=Labedella gwakjiensis TaxID=390269 RepID=A0A2P8GVS2_9MICO|nr:CPBP family intramembrane glutamic endopeptidase [Labedella gwakjiensis]PSL38064.1 CAAX prenyl protease-like protein [Labedella gwakjiensis]RUQ87378.1 CPBP family intramembrane metalloprotease [Labedella gwakjiensis]
MTASDHTGTGREGGIAALIRRRPLVSFFVLALGLSWVAWTPWILSDNGLGVLDFSFPEVLGTSQLTGMLFGAYLGPLGAAFVVTAVTGGRAGLRVWVGRLLRWRVAPRWYLVALFAVPAAVLLLGALASGGQVHAPSMFAVSLYVPALLLQMLTTGLAEEPGWRDFALPLLQDRFGPLGAAAVLGPLWGLWHVPLFFTEWGSWPNVTVLHVVEFIAFSALFNVVIMWLFNRTGQSLPIVMLFHVSLNNTVSIFWLEMFPTVPADMLQHVLLAGAAVAATVTIVLTRGRLGLPRVVPASERSSTESEKMTV